MTTVEIVDGWVGYSTLGIRWRTNPYSQSLLVSVDGWRRIGLSVMSSRVIVSRTELTSCSKSKMSIPLITYLHQWVLHFQFHSQVWVCPTVVLDTGMVTQWHGKETRRFVPSAISCTVWLFTKVTVSHHLYNLYIFTVCHSMSYLFTLY